MIKPHRQNTYLSRMCAQRRCRSACALAQSDQNLHWMHSSRKHVYIVLTPLNPTFIVKLGFTGVYIIFLISAQKHRLWICVFVGQLGLIVGFIVLLLNSLCDIRKMAVIGRLPQWRCHYSHLHCSFTILELYLKRNCIFTNAQNAQIQIQPRMRKISSEHLISTCIFCCIQLFC